MSTISTSKLKTLLDSLTAGKLIFDNAMGLLGTESNTVSKAASNDLVTLSSIADNDVQADLASVFRIRSLGVVASALYASLGAYNLWWALDKHCGNSGQAGVTNLDTFLIVNNVRVSSDLRQLGFPLSPQAILPPAVDPMATFTVTGSGNGTYTHVADVDTTQYGAAWLALKVTAQIGGSNVVVTVSGLQFDAATPVILTATIPSGSIVGTTVNLGTLGVLADSIDYVTGITITGGTAGDAFKVVSRVERDITPTS